MTEYETLLREEMTKQIQSCIRFQQLLHDVDETCRHLLVCAQEYENRLHSAFQAVSGEEDSMPALLCRKLPLSAAPLLLDSDDAD